MKHHKHAFSDLPKVAGSVILGLMSGKKVPEKQKEEERQKRRLELLSQD